MEKLARVSSWRNSPWRNAQERLNEVGRRGEGPSEEDALAGELDPARGLGRPARGA